MTLANQARRILDFETLHGTHTGRKQLAIQDELGIRPARYYQLLNRIIDALAAYPMLINRLRRIRDESRTEQRRRHGHL